MQIRMMDAIDVFSRGGYIDFQTMEYIPPKWYMDEFEPERGLTEEDYRRFDSLPEQYLPTPHFRLSGLCASAALQMEGVSRDQLVQMGFDTEACWEILSPQSAEMPPCSDHDWNAVQKLNQYMASIGESVRENDREWELMVNIVREWFAQREIDLVE